MDVQTIQLRKFTQSIYSMILIWHTLLFGKFSSQFDKKYTPSQIVVVSDMSYELWYCVYIEMYQNIQKIWRMGSLTVLFWGGGV